jgi:hypothetical protein
MLPVRVLVPRVVRGVVAVASPILPRPLWQRPPPPALDVSAALSTALSVAVRFPDYSRNLPLVIALSGGRKIGTAALCAVRAG